MEPAAGAFVFEEKESTPQQSALYDEHIKLTDKSRLAPFAGFLMPLWYSSISAEHNAVRTAAGLFDCSHMGVLEVKGPEALGFLNTVYTNDLSKIEPGRAQYGYIVDAAGRVLDDIIIYQRAEEKFMVVVNAANEPKIKAYFAALLKGEAIIDAEEPEKRLEYKPSIRDMREEGGAGDLRVDLALQGPCSKDIILDMVEDEQVRAQIEEMKPFRFVETRIAGIDAIVSRTGYTGAAMGFELYVYPAEAPKMWSLILAKWQNFGVLPCGLGARDSLRIEAGLPLYEHELAGPYDISPFEAGYGFAVKLGKEFFIGKAPLQKRAEEYNMEIGRFEFEGSGGVRPVRMEDALLNGLGECVGWVLSCAKVGDKQIALGFVDRESVKEGDDLGLYYLARSESQVKKGKKKEAKKGEQLQKDICGITLSRFAKF